MAPYDCFDSIGLSCTSLSFIAGPEFVNAEM